MAESEKEVDRGEAIGGDGEGGGQEANAAKVGGNRWCWEWEGVCVGGLRAVLDRRAKGEAGKMERKEDGEKMTTSQTFITSLPRSLALPPFLSPPSLLPRCLELFRGKASLPSDS